MRHRKLAITALVLAIAAAQTACGNKGPLYLPDDESAALATPGVRYG